MSKPDLKACLLIAHQDDELFCLDLLELYRPSLVVYLTDGVATHRKDRKVSPMVRSQESNTFMRSLPFDTKVIQFGILNSISDGNLYREFYFKHYLELVKIIKSHKIDLLITSHFEGGNQDHDIVFIISRMLSELHSLTRITFPTYRSFRNFPWLFRVMNLESKEVLLEPCEFPASILLHHFRNGLLSYKSQRKTWFGLGLFVTARYLKPTKLRRAIDAIEESNFYDKKPFFEIRKRATATEVTDKIHEILTWSIRALKTDIYE